MLHAKFTLLNLIEIREDATASEIQQHVHLINIEFYTSDLLFPFFYQSNSIDWLI